MYGSTAVLTMGLLYVLLVGKFWLLSYLIVRLMYDCRHAIWMNGSLGGWE